LTAAGPIGDIIEEVEAKVQTGTIQKFLSTLQEKALNLGLRIFLAAIFFLIGARLIKLLRKIIRRSMERANAELGVIQFVDSFVKATLYAVPAWWRCWGLPAWPWALPSRAACPIWPEAC